MKKHLFSDTDMDDMTEISWLKSSNRRPKPKVADYTRKPAKHIHSPVNITCMPDVHSHVFLVCSGVKP